MDRSPEYQAFKDDSLHIDLSSPFFADHVSRYWWARQFCRDKTVLDCACGKGYGSYILSQVARKAVGVDLNEKSLAIAARLFSETNLSFCKQDVTRLFELGTKFDVITAFEIIEHLPHEITDDFLQSLRGALKPNGVLLLSTPNHDVVVKSGVEIPDFHINNFKSVELKALLQRYFSSVTMLGQFKTRTALKQTIFDWDYFNLRHLAPKPKRARSATTAKAANLESPRSYFKLVPDFQNDYQFSPKHWRQAGLTVAVCRG